MSLLNQPVSRRAEPAGPNIARRGLILQWLTVMHGVIEASVGVTAGLAAGSVVLFGFGIDSLIEVLSAAVVMWRLLVHTSTAKSALADRVGLRLVGVCFLSLGLYVGGEALLSLVRHEVPRESVAGICVAVLSMIAMPVLSRAKRRLAAEVGSSAMRADAVQSELCAYLSAILLAGLWLNWQFGLWWADPVAALTMVPLILKEGVEALRGKACGCSSCFVPVLD